MDNHHSHRSCICHCIKGNENKLITASVCVFGSERAGDSSLSANVLTSNWTSHIISGCFSSKIFFVLNSDALYRLHELNLLLHPFDSWSHQLSLIWLLNKLYTILYYTVVITKFQMWPVPAFSLWCCFTPFLDLVLLAAAVPVCLNTPSLTFVVIPICLSGAICIPVFLPLVVLLLICVSRSPEASLLQWPPPLPSTDQLWDPVAPVLLLGWIGLHALIYLTPLGKVKHNTALWKYFDDKTNHKNI